MDKVSYKVIVNPKALLKTMKPFGKVINSTTVLPILESVVFSIKENKATITGTDLETYMIAEHDVEHEKGISFIFTVEFKKIIGFLADCEIGPVVIEYTPSANMLYIKQEDFRLRLSSEDANNFPKTPELKKLHNMTMDTKEVLPIMKIALNFVSNDDLRPAMTGVYLHDSPQRGLTVVSTDAHRMYWKTISPKTPDTMKGAQIIIPSRSIAAMLECIKGKELTLSHGEGYSLVQSGEYQVYFRAIDARYPDYEVVMVAPETFFFLKRKQMLTFLKLAMHFVNRSTNQVEFIVDKASIATRGGDVDFDVEFSYKVPIYNSNNPDMRFSFAANAKFLMQALSVVKDEYVKIQTTMLETKAFLIDECLLVMPLMLNR